MKKIPVLSLCAGGALLLAGCHTSVQTGALVTGGVTLAGARTPSQDLEQIYYLGVFDPEEQLPPTFYRLTVRGQASAMSRTRPSSCCRWSTMNCVVSPPLTWRTRRRSKR